YCAARTRHSSFSPVRYESLSSLLASRNSGRTSPIFLKQFCLMSSYFVHCVRKCSSVSTVPCSQWGHSLFSLGSQVCLCLPTSMARLCSLSLYLCLQCLSLSLSVSLSLCLSISLFVSLCLSVSLSLCPSLCLSLSLALLFSCPSLSLSLSVSLSLSLSLSVCLSLSLSLSLCLCLSLSLSL